MKLIRHTFIAILLGLFLAVGSWQVAHAPQYKEPIADKDHSVQVDSKNTPRPIADTQITERNTVTADNSDQLPVTGPETATPDIDTDSCSNGPIGSGVFVWPTDNHSLSGSDFEAGHPGIDIAAGEGSPVYAVDAGLVIAKGNDPNSYGNVVQIDHGNGYLTVYAHLSEIGVRICQHVEAGQWIGAAGSTGNARGAHLHFEIAQDGLYIDPWDFLP